MPVHVLTHHKCASTWLMAWLEAAARLNGLTVAASQYGDRLPGGDADIVLLVNADYGFVSGAVDEGLHVIRNPLDVVVSAWHSHRATHATDGWPELEARRARLQAASRAEGLVMTAEFISRPDFYDGTPGPLRAMADWDYDDPRFQTLRMEDMVAGPAATVGVWLQERLGRALALPADADFRFERFSGERVPGEVDETSHYRSGRPNQGLADLPPDLAQSVIDDLRLVVARFYPDSL